MRGKGLNPVMLLAAILAVGILLAAHVPLHDFAGLDAGHHHDNGDQPASHEHPIRSLTIVLFGAIVLMVAFVVPVVPSLATVVVRPVLASASAIRCDNDIGLYDVLSTYRI